MKRGGNIAGTVLGLMVVVACIIFVVHEIHTDNSSAIGNGSATSQNNESSPDQNTIAAPAQNTSPAPASCVSASDASEHEDGSGCVTFTGYQYTSSRGEMYLDQSLSPPYGFSVYIPAGSSFGASVLNQYSGKRITVTGTIQDYRGEPEIEVTDASQIQLAQ